MAFRVRRVSYFYLTVPDRPGEAYKLLALFADRGIKLSAVTAIPTGAEHTQLSIVPEDPSHLVAEARRAGLMLDGPHHALLAQGRDDMAALADLHRKLYDANVNIYAASGVNDGEGHLGYLIYIRPEEFETAAQTLGV